MRVIEHVQLKKILRKEAEALGKDVTTMSLEELGVTKVESERTSVSELLFDSEEDRKVKEKLIMDEVEKMTAVEYVTRPKYYWKREADLVTSVAWVYVTKFWGKG